MPSRCGRLAPPTEMVVLYDEDGKSIPAIGNKFVESGVDNTYVVSGGFLQLCATCPHVLVGLPPSVETLTSLMARAGLKAPGAPSARSEYGAPSARCSTAGSVRTQTSKAPSVAGGAKAWK